MQTEALQEQRIKKYLKDVEVYLDELPPAVRPGELNRLRAQIERDLAALQGDRPMEPELERAIHRLVRPNAPGVVALPSIRPIAIPKPPSLALRDGEWLGVCAGLAHYFGIAPFHIRLAAVTLGLLTGPFMLIAYLAAYGLMRVGTVDEELPRLEPYRLALAVAATLATALAIYAVAQLVVVTILHVRGLVLAPYEGDLAPAWGWYAAHSGKLFFWTLLCSLPLAVFGGLPMAFRWDGTMTRLAKAALAVYGLVACLGVASALVGVILQVIELQTGLILTPPPAVR